MREPGYKKYNRAKGKAPLNLLNQPLQTRSWQDPAGYKRLIIWQNGMLLRVLIRVWTEGLPRNEYRLKAQVDDAARSYSQGSLEEIKGDVRDSAIDGLLKSSPNSTLKNTLNITLKQRPNPENWIKEIKGKFSKGELKGSDLTVEIFNELINKTEWNHNRLIRSLEEKTQGS